MDRLCRAVTNNLLEYRHGNLMFVRAYARETQEMVFDAHDRAFAF